MITYKMHLIRTGSTSSETPRRIVGQLDPELTPEGIDALNALADECDYPRVEMVYTSPLRRCRQTADILYPDTYTEVSEELIDMCLGRFEGLDFVELKDDPDFAAWLENSAENPPPDGEKPADFMERIVRGVREIFSRMMSDGIRDVAVVTHGGVIMSLLAGIGLPKLDMRQWACANGTGYTLLFTPQMWMRDGCAEIRRAIPEPRGEEDYDSFI